MQKKSAGPGILIGVGGDGKDGAAKIWGQLVVGLLRNIKNRILEGWLSPSWMDPRMFLVLNNKPCQNSLLTSHCVYSYVRPYFVRNHTCTVH